MSNTSVLATGSGSPRPGRRIDALDVARGIAILGTLWTNIWIFTHPDGLLGMLLDPVVPGTGTGEVLAQLAIMALSQGKFLALLTLMFGMGLAIQFDSAERRGIRWPGGYLWRAFLLLVDGVINYVLIAEFDVLMGYAVTGAIVAWLLLTRPRTQRALIIVFGALHALVITLVVVVVALTSGGEAASVPVGTTPYAHGSFLDLVAFRLDNLALFRAEPILIGFLTLAMFLLGAALHRAAVFAPESGRLRKRLMIVGAIALPVDLVLGTVGGAAGMLAERYLAAPLVALGLLGLIAEWCVRQGTDGWVARRLREVGRTALTCYLLQNLVAGALFYGWGLGLAGDLVAWRLPVTMAGYVVVAAVVMVFAHLWLRRFRLGPVEWLWKQGARIVPDRPRAAPDHRPVVKAESGGVRG
ncbi:DUF418 domain-containing protein [Pseudoclavibacter chungangensis]|uniref:DUF418 domain-containing protein n=1 Tax=Pseudoclavibacter chungangensis TaxID=587635 RepID=A0A7J5BTJ2_9MICO|nr:DUF418 domain-containing protein [Pseudoclavibacter chungangensis]KAB1656857.1 DUF418 domain-containing protein [Pseudoclavibacter chungangensis]NYJ67321.1 uncharacterized protein [Pseudoclavibacter chungangensis]